jgi:hypothetical protein
MTTLDDGIASPAPIWVAPLIKAVWEGQDYRGSGSVDDLGQQLGDGFGIEHSYDDGLPDPVTMTASVDASGVMSADLNGKDPIAAVTTGWRTATGIATVTTESTTGALAFPAECQVGDFCLFAVACNDSATIEIQDNATHKLTEFIPQTEVQDGVTGSLRVWGKIVQQADLGVTVTFLFGQTTSWAIVAAPAWATAANGNPVTLWPVDAGVLQELAAVTSHTAYTVTIPAGQNGFVVGIWMRGELASSTLTWTPPAGDTELKEVFGTFVNNAALAVSTSPYVGPGSYTKVGVTSGAGTLKALMGAIALVAMERPDRMEAREYFSPFVTTSPVYGLDRDVAPLSVDFGVLTSDGPQYVRLFRGQMADIAVKGRQANLGGISAGRVGWMRSAQPPVVWGNRSRLNLTWYLTWLMGEAGFFVGPRPERTTRFWATGYGSMHGNFDGGGSSYYYSAFWDADTDLDFNRPPSFVEGPYMLAMFGQQTELKTEELNFIPEPSPYVHPSVQAYHQEPALYDLMSVANDVCKIEFWVRGDPHVASPAAYDPSGGMELVTYKQYNKRSTGFIDCYIEAGVLNASRLLYFKIGDDTATIHTVTTALTLPSDGDWHYCAFAWEWDHSFIAYQLDGTLVPAASTGFTTTGANRPATDAAYKAAGHQLVTMFKSRLPVSDIKLAASPSATVDPFEYNNPADANAVIRALVSELEVIAEPSPVNLWDKMTDLARATLSAYRMDEDDFFRFMPLSYFGEAAQITATEVVSTETNAQDLDVIADPTKTRNVVTVEFADTRVEDRIRLALASTTVIPVPRGLSTITVPFDVPVAEVYLIGGIVPSNVMTNLTSTQVTNNTPPTSQHFISFNSKEDGTGTYYTSVNITAKIISVDAYSATIQLNNVSGADRFITNSNGDCPSLGIYGYVINTGSGYETRRDAASTARRRERSLDAQILQIQRREDAGDIASQLTAMLCQPREQISVKVMGDPRRVPGQVVTLADAQGTRASGTWRITGIRHNRSGAEYTQDLSLFRVLPVGVWDTSNWDEAVWGE